MLGILKPGDVETLANSFPLAEALVKMASSHHVSSESIITLGFDIKITPQGEPKIIEINGRHSGIKGLSELTGVDLEEERIRCRVQLALQRNMRRADFCYGKESMDSTSFSLDCICAAEGSKSIENRYKKYREQAHQDQKEKLRRLIALRFKKWLLGKRHPGLNYKIRQEIVQFCQEAFFEDEEFGIGFFDQYQGQRSEEFYAHLRDFMKDFFIEEKPNEGGIIDVDTNLLTGRLWVHPSYFLAESTDVPEIISEHEGFLKWTVFVGLPRNTHEMERVLNDKIAQKELIPPRYNTLYIAPETHIEEYLVKFATSLRQHQATHNTSDKSYVVVKYARGCQGKEVSVFGVHDLDGIISTYLALPPHERLVEEFVPSKPIIRPFTQKPHDGCMRYLVDIHTQEILGRRKWRPIFEAAYWRLAPVSLSDNFPNDQKFKANLAAGAIPTRCSWWERRIARKAVYQTLERMASKAELFDDDNDNENKSTSMRHVSRSGFWRIISKIING